MPIKLPPLNLRLLQNPTFPLAMKPGAPSARALPAFARIFPFRLKYNKTSLSRSQLGHRAFSTRRGGDARSAGAAKSLIEDEAELSDWVSELRPDSHKGLLTSEEEGDDEDDGWSRRDGGYRGNADEDDGRFRGRGDVGLSRGRGWMRGRGRGGYSMREEGDHYKGRGGKRGGFSMSEDEEVGEFRGGRGNVGLSRGRGAKRGGYSMSEDEEVGEFRGGRGNVGLSRGRGGKRGGYAMSEDEDRRRGMGGRGDMGLSRGKGEVRGVKRKGFMMDEDDEDRKRGMSGLGELLSGEEIDILDDEEDEEEVQEITKKSESSLFGADKGDSGVNVGRTSPAKSDSFMSESRFDQCSLSPLSLKGVKDAGFEKMTVVQEATLPVILKGKDVMAKAKTGTGKTVAFLLPAIEVVVKSPSADRDQRRPPILVLVVCPTRELATQAATEANTLLKYHPSIGVQVVIGGTRLALEQKRMQANPCQVLVATPGRLRDHVENTAGFASRLMGVKVLVLDEADHLLDMGFRKDIEKIIAAVPKQRQTLLFSATIPDEVRQISHIALKRDHEFINTVQEGSGDTHSQVRQTHLVAPLEKHFPLLYVLLKEHISDNVDYKVLVFCTTAMVTRLVADFLGELKLNVREIHSRKPQSYRTRVSDEFRKSKGLILVTSDVSARGVDYPDVTFVIQVGLPSDREQYIHRLGRTGRKGKEGQGILLLAPWEEFFLSTVKDLPIVKSVVPSVDPDTKKKVERALSQVEMKNKEAAYQSWLGYYNSNKKVGKDKYRLVELANEFSRSMGLDNPPAIPKLVLGKMGLKNIPGLRSK